MHEARRRRARLEELFARLTEEDAVTAAVDAGATPAQRPLGRLLGAEVRWVLRRPRTLVMLGLFALVPVADRDRRRRRRAGRAGGPG